MENIKIVKTTSDRFVITNTSGEILCDAQGFGYKSYVNAIKAANYKFKGGKKRAVETKKEFSKWKKENPNSGKIIQSFQDATESYFKSIALGEISFSDIFEAIEKEFQCKLSSSIRKELKK